jgi:glycosyltransferase involved in cell wall biosynthesis
MKISLVAQQPSAHDKIWLRELSRALRAAGHDVTVDTAGSDLPVTGEDRLAAVPDLAGRLRAKWRRDRPDVVHALRWTSGLAALSATRGLAVPVVVSFGSLALAENTVRPARERGRLEAAIGRSAAAVLAASSDERAGLVRMGVSRRAITVVPTGVDPATFTQEGPAALRKAARNAGPRRIIMVGDLAGHMGTGLRSLTRLPGIEMLIAGGPDNDSLGGDDACLALARLAKTLAVADRATFTGHVGYDDLPALLRSADLMVVTAPHEPDGMSVLAAMACGLPVVAGTKSGAVADIVIDGVTGLLLPEGRPALLADRVRKLLAHPMLLSGMSVAAVDRAKSRFSWDRIAAETLASYEFAVESRRFTAAA